MATYTNLDDEIFARNALEGFVKELLPLNAFSLNFSPEPARKGNNVLVPLIAAITATTFNNAYNVTGGSMSVVTVALSHHRIAQVGQSDIEEAGSSMAQLERFAYQQGAGLAQLVVQDILSVCTTATANFAAATSISSSSMDVAQIRRSRLLLNQDNAPGTGRALILDCVPYDYLLGVTNFVQAHMFGDRTVIAEGRVPRALGFDMYEINSLFPSTGSVMGFACTPAAVAIGMRYLAPQPGHNYSRAMAITDPKTGATLGLRDHYDNNVGRRFVNLECVFGFAVGITKAGRIIRRLD